MRAVDLYLLGRRLTRLGEEAIGGPEARHVPTGLRLIVIDVGEHPDSSIGEIAARTGLPQSHVSQSVARLRARGALETTRDPRDGRRTLVRMSPGVAERAAGSGSVAVDAALGEAMNINEPGVLAEHVSALEAVLAQLRQAEAAASPAPGRRSAWPLEDKQ